MIDAIATKYIATGLGEQQLGVDVHTKPSRGGGGNQSPEGVPTEARNVVHACHPVPHEFQGQYPMNEK